VYSDTAIARDALAEEVVQEALDNTPLQKIDLYILNFINVYFLYAGHHVEGCSKLLFHAASRCEGGQR
jgi:hypothetical protein